MMENNQLKKIYFPNVESIGSCSLRHNKSVEEVIAPKAKSIGIHFLEENKNLKQLIVSKELEEKLGRMLDLDQDHIMIKALKVK